MSPAPDLPMARFLWWLVYWVASDLFEGKNRARLVEAKTKEGYPTGIGANVWRGLIADAESAMHFAEFGVVQTLSP